MKKFLTALAAIALASCAAAPAYTLPHRDPAMSWDQANLKLDDHGCPTAIFVAPGGDLVACQPSAEQTAKDTGLKYFKSVDAAAIYVVSLIYEKSHYYEYGGVILKAPQGYVVSKPTTQRHGMDVTFDEDPESYQYPIVASYHVHPCMKGAFSSVFSPQDLAGSRATRTPGYVLDECTGAVHYWAPGDGYMSGEDMLKLGIPLLVLMQDVQLSSGKVIGSIAVDGAVLN